MDFEKLNAEFERIAHISEEDNIARLTSPGVEGFKIFLEIAFEGNTIEVEEIRRVYEAKGWSEDRSLIWAEVESMVEILIKDTTPSEDEKDEYKREESTTRNEDKKDEYKQDESNTFAVVRKQLAVVNIYNYATVTFVIFE